ncbi:MAG: peroxide stress protein YaaA [Bacteroidota bacterium]|nr:peroxide stress protein YaaA [Bacteroidota bacterium]
MIFLISPSKDLDFKTDPLIHSTDTPRLWNQSQVIIEVLRKKSVKSLMKLMDISEKLAQENVKRNLTFNAEFTRQNSKPAMYAFAGDVYRGLDSKTLSQIEVNYCQKHLRILSGLYGILKPLDLMQAYRLEMGTDLTIKGKKNLYTFWGPSISQVINEDVDKSNSKLVINLASKEYFAAVKANLITVPIINMHFREQKNGKLQFVSYTAKKARGLVVRYMAQKKSISTDMLKSFNSEGYYFEEKISDSENWYFIR